MPRLDCNLAEVKEIENLPSGVYSVVCVGVQLIESSVQKTPGIQLEVQFTDPGTEIAPGVPRKWRNNETTLWKSKDMGWQTFKVKEAVEAFGVPYDNGGFDTENFLNASAKIAVGQETFTRKDGEPGIKNTLEHWLRA